jgi:maleylacetoacetate isomerase
MQLYSYFRSSAAYRVRIALHLKGIPFDTVPVHLTRDGGRQHAAEFAAVNPQKRVPALVLPGGKVLLQSLAIIDYLDEVHPHPPFLPADPIERARVRAVAQIVACDIHPLNNLAPLEYLRHTLKADKAAVQAWYRHWVVAGFEAVEALVGPGPHAFGSPITLADICLVPQVANARRLAVALDGFPRIVALDAACAKHPAFDAARPERQPDAE